MVYVNDLDVSPWKALGMVLCGVRERNGLSQTVAGDNGVIQRDRIRKIEDGQRPTADEVQLIISKLKGKSNKLSATREYVRMSDEEELDVFRIYNICQWDRDRWQYTQRSLLAKWRRLNKRERAFDPADILRTGDINEELDCIRYACIVLSILGLMQPLANGWFRCCELVETQCGRGTRSSRATKRDAAARAIAILAQAREAIRME